MAAAAHCVHHTDRPGHALCMECHQVVCAECATDWDGINYCVACLERRRGALRSGRRLPGWLVLGLASGLLLVATARVMVWTAVLLAGLR